MKIRYSNFLSCYGNKRYSMNKFETEKLMRSIVLLFSFSPYLSLKSAVTDNVLAFLYALFIIRLAISMSKSKIKIAFLRRKLPIFLVLSLFLIYGCINNPVVAWKDDFVSLIFPVFIAIYYVIDSHKLDKSKIESVIKLYIFCALANSIMGIFQTITFRGNFASLYVGHYAEEAPYNYYRHGHLRALGFQASPVTLSYYLVPALIILFCACGRKLFQRLRYILIAIIFLALILTGCRVPVLSLFLCLFCWKVIPQKRRLLKFLPLIVLSIMLILLNLFDASLDSSALGRFPQFQLAWELFVSHPLGYGMGYASYPFGVVSFDPSILTILINYGVIGITIWWKVYIHSISNEMITEEGKLITLNLFLVSLFSNVFSVGAMLITITLINCYNLNKIEISK